MFRPNRIVILASVIVLTLGFAKIAVGNQPPNDFAARHQHFMDRVQIPGDVDVRIYKALLEMIFSNLDSFQTRIDACYEKTKDLTQCQAGVNGVPYMNPNRKITENDIIRDIRVQDGVVTIQFFARPGSPFKMDDTIVAKPELTDGHNITWEYEGTIFMAQAQRRFTADDVVSCPAPDDITRHFDTPIASKSVLIDEDKVSWLIDKSDKMQKFDGLQFIWATKNGVMTNKVGCVYEVKGAPLPVRWVTLISKRDLRGVVAPALWANGLCKDARGMCTFHLQ